jgi:hypothetical protein
LSLYYKLSNTLEIRIVIYPKPNLTSIILPQEVKLSFTFRSRKVLLRFDIQHPTNTHLHHLPFLPPSRALTPIAFHFSFLILNYYLFFLTFPFFAPFLGYFFSVQPNYRDSVGEMQRVYSHLPFRQLIRLVSIMTLFRIITTKANRFEIRRFLYSKIRV